jgi:hypothetical protein
MRGRTASLTIDSSFGAPLAPGAAGAGSLSGTGAAWGAATALAPAGAGGGGGGAAGLLAHALSMGRSSFGSPTGSPRTLSGLPSRGGTPLMLGPGAAPGLSRAASASPSLLASAASSRAASGALGPAPGAAGFASAPLAPLSPRMAQASAAAAQEQAVVVVGAADEAWPSKSSPPPVLGLPLAPPERGVSPDALAAPAGSPEPPQHLSQQQVWALISQQQTGGAPPPGPAAATQQTLGPGAAVGGPAVAAPAPPSDLAKEMAVMRRLDHPNVVRLHEVIFDPADPRLIIMVRRRCGVHGRRVSVCGLRA